MSDTDNTNHNDNTPVPPDSPTNPQEVHEAREELAQAIRGSHELLASATTVFPFTPFPDTIAIDRTKITITHRTFFSVAENMSIRIEDILNVTANTGPFFGSLKIVSRILSPDKPYEINFLWQSDALKLKRILQGYVIAMQKKIDVSPLETKELADMLGELGKDDHADGS